MACARPAKPKKKVATVDSVDVSNEILDRLKVLEDRQAEMIKGFKFAAEELKPMFGLTHVSAVFDAIYKKLRK